MQVYNFIINKINWKGSALSSLEFLSALNLFFLTFWTEKEELKVISKLLKNAAEFGFPLPEQF